MVSSTKILQLLAFHSLSWTRTIYRRKSKMPTHTLDPKLIFYVKILHFVFINKFSKRLNSYIMKISWIFRSVCQPISKKFGDPLPIWWNPNFIFYQCPWCISSRVELNYEHSALYNMCVLWTLFCSFFCEPNLIYFLWKPSSVVVCWWALMPVCCWLVPGGARKCALQSYKNYNCIA